MSVALVTGGSRGIGAACATRLADDGYDIAIAYRRDRRAAEEVAERVRASGRRAAIVQADLAAADAAAGLPAQVADLLGPIVVLVINAGAGEPVEPDVRKVTPEDWDRTLAVNLRAPFLIARAAIGPMLDRGFGRIVLISSVAAYVGGFVGPHYAASKAGLHGLAHSLARLGAGRDVTANVVAPALIATDMLPADRRDELAESIPVGRLGRPEEVADLVAAIVRNGYMTSQSILLDGGLHPT
jgi:3-oxoacyl-[acyl-carrier protein] reductase